MANTIYDADRLYFNEADSGISSGLNFDMLPGINWDAYANTTINLTVEMSLVGDTYYAHEILDIDIKVDFDVDENYSNYIDLMELVPAKFRESVALQEFIYEAGLMTGEWLGYINDTITLLDKYTVGDEYLQNLADLVGLDIITDSTTTLDERRQQLIQVIDWYKLKGTYQAIDYISYLFNVTLTFWDLYTNDYVTFIQQPWFVGNSQDENPGGLDSSYYKSPHFGIVILLDTVFGVAPNKHLFVGGGTEDLSTYIERVRPINTVPHYGILLQPVGDETGIANEVPGEILTATIGDWDFTKFYWDDPTNVDNVIDSNLDLVVDDLGNTVTVLTPHSFDDGDFFDYSRDAFLNSIVKWKLGTGNKGVSPDTPGFALANVVLTSEDPGMSGQIITLYSDRSEYFFTVPTTVVQAGISELGLYLFDGTTLEIAATFPDIDKEAGMELQVKVIIYR